MNRKQSRREFLKSAGMGAAVSLAAGGCAGQGLAIGGKKRSKCEKKAADTYYPCLYFITCLVASQKAEKVQLSTSSKSIAWIDFTVDLIFYCCKI